MMNKKKKDTYKYLFTTSKQNPKLHTVCGLNVFI